MPTMPSAGTIMFTVGFEYNCLQITVSFSAGSH